MLLPRIAMNILQTRRGGIGIRPALAAALMLAAAGCGAIDENVERDSLAVETPQQPASKTLAALPKELQAAYASTVEREALDAYGASMPWAVDGASVKSPSSADALAWAQQARLAGDSSAFYFGMSVSLSGDTALIGTSDSAYVFVRSGDKWEQQAILVADDAAPDDFFGSAVSLSGDTALIGAYADDDLGEDSGSAYIFVRNGTAWTQQAKLLPKAGLITGRFGFSVSLSGDTALVGALGDADFYAVGAAYVYVRSGTTWTQQAKLQPDILLEEGWFGWPVAMDGDTALVADFWDNVNGKQSGAAYVFARNGTTWVQEAKLFADDGAPIDNFGSAVAISGHTAVVGARYDDSNANDTGSAYVFTRAGTTWTQQAKLEASDGTADAQFGTAVALNGDRMIVGAPGAAVSSPMDGVAYLFARNGSTWTAESKVVPMGGGGQSFFGGSVSLSADAALVGAPQEMQDISSGAAYVGMLGQANGDPCVSATECASRICTAGICGNPDGTPCTGGMECTSGFCADGVCCNSACGNGTPNDCEACSVAQGAAKDGTCKLLGAGTVCRSPVALCDAPEVCNGVTTTCPEDVLFTAGVECRPALGTCDIAERCDGVSIDCPADEFVPDTTLCGTPEGICNGVVSPDGTGCGECYSGKCEPYYDYSGHGYGCGCRMPSPTSTDFASGPLGLLGLAVFWALRRRPR